MTAAGCDLCAQGLHTHWGTDPEAPPATSPADRWEGVPCWAADCDLPARCLVVVIPGAWVACRTSQEAARMATTRAGVDAWQWPEGPACHDHACDATSDALYTLFLNRQKAAT